MHHKITRSVYRFLATCIRDGEVSWKLSR